MITHRKLKLLISNVRNPLGTTSPSGKLVSGGVPALTPIITGLPSHITPAALNLRQAVNILYGYEINGKVNFVDSLFKVPKGAEVMSYKLQNNQYVAQGRPPGYYIGRGSFKAYRSIGREARKAYKAKCSTK